MAFNPNPNKQAEKVIFGGKVKDYHPHLTFNNDISYHNTPQKDLDIILGNRLSLEEHLRLVFNKIIKTIGLSHKLLCLVSRSTLLTVYKTFVRPHLLPDNRICPI